MLHRFLVMNQALTVLYLMVEVGRWGPDEVKSEVQQTIRMSSSRVGLQLLNFRVVALEPGLLQYLTNVIARTRWQDTPRLPFTRVCPIRK